MACVVGCYDGSLILVFVFVFTFFLSFYYFDFVFSCTWLMPDRSAIHCEGGVDYVSWPARGDHIVCV